ATSSTSGCSAEAGPRGALTSERRQPPISPTDSSFGLLIGSFCRTTVRVQMEHFPGRRRLDRAALDLQEAGIAPDELHHMLDARPAPEGAEKDVGNGAAVDGPDPRADDESQSRSSVGALLLDQLIVEGRAAEPLRQNLLEHAHHVGAQERHASGGELLEAANRVHMGLPAQSLERATARASVHRS